MNLPLISELCGYIIVLREPRLSLYQRNSKGDNMITDLVITKLDTARTALAEAKTIQETKKILDIASAAEIYVKRQQLGEEAIKYATAIKVEALAQLGRMLKETLRAEARFDEGNQKVPSSNLQPTLANLGLDKKTSKLAQDIANLPEEQFERVKQGVVSITKARREAAVSKVNRVETALPSAKYRILYADPPWSYGDKLTENYGTAEYHYRTMTLAELKALPIKEVAEDNSVLFLWVTSPMIPESLEVIEAWGFDYKASFVWDKVKHNMGHYNSVRHELLFICTRGSCLPDNNKLYDSVQVIERTKHSEKPELFRNIIDDLYISGSRIELFARRKVTGWDSWGDEL